uniref:Uncharacterized protein n=1 Tax=Arundo donax TaxID=35708 RepID=A0A0A9G6R0_ARUDO
MTYYIIYALQLTGPLCCDS